ncbi:MAG: hypothetical protein M0Q13_03290 [Methanothrix sp.]|nr:hypothetical protein [Methanothrix sp.]
MISAKPREACQCEILVTTIREGQRSKTAGSCPGHMIRSERSWQARNPDRERETVDRYFSTPPAYGIQK